MSVELFVRDDGPADAETFVFLHSLFFDGSMFDDVLTRLPGRNRYLRPDHLGQGASGGHGDPDLGMDRLAELVVGLIETRTASPVHLVGSSMGGYVALRVALNRPDLLATCTLLGASAAAEPEPERFAVLAEALADVGPAALVDTIAWTMFGDDLLTDKTSLALQRWRDHFAGLRRDVAAAVRGVAARESVTDRLSELTVPLLLIAGEQDHAKPPAHMAVVAQAVPGSRLRVLAGTGHTPAVERPGEVARELTDWVGRQSLSLGRDGSAALGGQLKEMT